MLQFPLYTIIIIIRIAFIGLQIYVFQDLSKLIRLGFFLMKSERKNLKFSTRQKRKPRRRESRDSAVTFCARDAREPCVWDSIQAAFQLHSNRMLLSTADVEYIRYKFEVANLEWAALSALILEVDIQDVTRLNHVDH